MLRSIIALVTLVLLVLVLLDKAGPTLSASPLAADSVTSVSARLRMDRRPRPRPTRPTRSSTATTPKVVASLGAEPESKTATIDRLSRLAVRQRIRAEGDRTYLDSMLVSTDSMVRRWPEAVRPTLRVAVITGGPADFSPRMEDFVHEALSSWEALRIGVRFTVVGDTGAADITVRWIDHFRIDRAGQTDLTWDRLGRIRHASILLALRDSAGYRLPDLGLRAVAVHEVGHALGLPHSSDFKDVMYPAAPVVSPSDRDRRTVSVLYELPPGSIKDIGQK